MIKGIAFDLEGTVIDVEYAHHQGHILAAAEVGVNLTLDSALDLIPHFIGGPDEKIVEEIWTLSDKSKTIHQLLDRTHYFYEIHLHAGIIAPRNGFLDFVHTCTAQGLKIAIGSLTPMDQANLLLEKSGILKLFPNTVVLREDVERVKPAPDVFLKTAECMGILPEEQLVFEDSPRGIEAALTAGSRAIGMPVYWRTDTINALTKSGATILFRKWDDVDITHLLI